MRAEPELARETLHSLNSPTHKFFKKDYCLCSDHFPTFLACGGHKGGMKSFKFENSG
jgi:hypothetical protein